MLFRSNQVCKRFRTIILTLGTIWLGMVSIPLFLGYLVMVKQWNDNIVLQFTGSVAQAQELQRRPKQSLKKVSRRLYKLRSEKLYEPLIHRAANVYQVDPALIKAIIKAESGFNPEALSHRGAIGLMQLMPTTAKSLGVKDCFNPKHNINGGVKYFSQLLERFRGNVELALAAYNAGSRYVKKYRGIPPFKATQIYVEKVIQYYQNYKKLPATV
jgi:soluble lytic murein transglycosylase-like protein